MVSGIDCDAATKIDIVLDSIAFVRFANVNSTPR